MYKGVEGIDLHNGLKARRSRVSGVDNLQGGAGRHVSERGGYLPSWWAQSTVWQGVKCRLLRMFAGGRGAEERMQERGGH